MADATGTPAVAPDDASKTGGTPGKTPDDSAGGKQITVDAGLFNSYKQSAEEKNRLKEELKEKDKKIEQMNAEADRRVADAQRAAFAPPTADPMAPVIAAMREQASIGNPLAIFGLEAANAAVGAQREAQITDEMVSADVPKKHWRQVKDILRQSPQINPDAVQRALGMARGGEADDLEKQLKDARDKIAALEREQADGATRVPGKSATVVPAGDVSAGDESVMAYSDYRTALKRGGPEAVALLKRGPKLDYSR